MARLRSLDHPSAVLFACLFASQSALLVLSPTLIDVARDLGVSTATAGQLRSISGATGGLTALVLATAARRPGLRELLSAGAAIVAVGSGLSAAAPSFTVLAGAQAVLGVGIGLLVAVGIAASGEWPAPPERPQVLAWAIAGMPAAWIVGMPVIGAVADSGWRPAWIAVPGAAGLLALALVRIRPPDVLSDALASIECDLAAEHAAGDHWIVVGQVHRLRVCSDARPLVYFAGRFGGFQPH